MEYLRSPQEPMGASHEDAAPIEPQPFGLGKSDDEPAMQTPMLVFLGVYILALLIVLLFLLARLWPVTKDTFETTPFPWGAFTFHVDVRYMLIAACAGALGSYIHLATSFADYAGNRALKVSWAWWYFFRPCIGAALAEVVYLAIRAGIVGSGQGTEINPFGIASLCSLCGLFSKQATDKLREVFETIFRTQAKVERKDPLPQATPSARATSAGVGGKADSAGSAT